MKVPNSDEEFYLHPATVRRNDRSAESVVRKHFLFDYFVRLDFNAHGPNQLKD